MRNWWTCSGTTTGTDAGPERFVGDVDEFWRNHLPIEGLRRAATPVTRSRGYSDGCYDEYIRRSTPEALPHDRAGCLDAGRARLALHTSKWARFS
jgi:hypothetical protein